MGNSSAIVAALVGAVTTGVLGNYLVQRWQRQSWFAQQRQLFHQQELDELKDLYDEISERGEARLTSMRRLVAVLLDDPPELEKALDEYRNQLTLWNSALRSFFPPITLHYGWHKTLQLENEIHANFVAVGRLLEQQVRLVKGGGKPLSANRTVLQTRLNLQAGALSEFYQDLANGVAKRRDEVLNGKRHWYRSGGLSHFSTSDLIKALFTSNVDGFNVVRPA